MSNILVSSSFTFFSKFFQGLNIYHYRSHFLFFTLRYLKIRWISIRQQEDRFCYLIHSTKLCHLISVLRPLIFKVFIERYMLIPVSCSLFVFLVLFCASVIAAYFFLLSILFWWPFGMVKNGADLATQKREILEELKGL